VRIRVAEGFERRISRCERSSARICVAREAKGIVGEGEGRCRM
jgi:hypothetical protein